jgi:hypothetical protein
LGNDLYLDYFAAGRKGNKYATIEFVRYGKASNMRVEPLPIQGGSDLLDQFKAKHWNTDQLPGKTREWLRGVQLKVWHGQSAPPFLVKGDDGTLYTLNLPDIAKDRPANAVSGGVAPRAPGPGGGPAQIVASQGKPGSTAGGGSSPDSPLVIPRRYLKKLGESEYKKAYLVKNGSLKGRVLLFSKNEGKDQIILNEDKAFGELRGLTLDRLELHGEILTNLKMSDYVADAKLVYVSVDGGPVRPTLDEEKFEEFSTDILDRKRLGTAGPGEYSKCANENTIRDLEIIEAILWANVATSEDALQVGLRLDGHARVADPIKPSIGNYAIFESHYSEDVYNGLISIAEDNAARQRGEHPELRSETTHRKPPSLDEDLYNFKFKRNFASLEEFLQRHPLIGTNGQYRTVYADGSNGVIEVWRHDTPDIIYAAQTRQLAQVRRLRSGNETLNDYVVELQPVRIVIGKTPFYTQRNQRLEWSDEILAKGKSANANAQTIRDVETMRRILDANKASIAKFRVGVAGDGNVYIGGDPGEVRDGNPDPEAVNHANHVLTAIEAFSRENISRDGTGGSGPTG